MTFQACDPHTILNANARFRANARGDNFNLFTGQCQLCHQILNNNLLATQMRWIICGDMNYARSFHSISTHSSFAWQCSPSQILVLLPQLPESPSTAPRLGFLARRL